ALDGADDADGDGVLITVSVADGDDRLADHEVGGGAHGHDGQGLVDVDLEQGQVALGVAGDDAGTRGSAVRQPAADQADVLDHVLVRYDVAARVDDDAGAHAVDAVLRRGQREQLVGGRALDGAFAVDVDDGGPDALDHIDDVTAAPAGGRGGRDKET